MYFFRHFTNRLSIHSLFKRILFKLFLVIFLQVFFFHKIFSFDNTNIFYAFEKHLKTLFVLHRAYTHFNAYKTSSFMFSFEIYSINVTFWMKGPMHPQSLSRFSSTHLSFHFLQPIYLPINNSNSIS